MPETHGGEEAGGVYFASSNQRRQTPLRALCDPSGLVVGRYDIFDFILTEGVDLVSLSNGRLLRISSGQKHIERAATQRERTALEKFGAFIWHGAPLG